MDISILKKTTFPKEHGSWGFVYEPLLLSLLVAFTVNGLVYAIITFLLFLSSQPIKILFSKSINPKFKSLALYTLLIYSSAIIILALYLFFNSNLIFGIPFVVAVLLMLFFLSIDLVGKGRYLLFEFIPPIAITAVAMSILLMDNSFSYNIFFFGILLLSRSIPTIFYINAKVKELKGKNYSPSLSYFAEGVFSILIIYLATNDLVPSLCIGGSLLLLFRTVVGFSKFNFTKRVVQIGIAEFIYGGLFVLINAIAFNFY